jgi:hypothetical protein
MTGKRQTSSEDYRDPVMNIPLETEEKVNHGIMMFERKNEESFDITDDDI